MGGECEGGEGGRGDSGGDGVSWGGDGGAYPGGDMGVAGDGGACLIGERGVGLRGVIHVLVLELGLRRCDVGERLPRVAKGGHMTFT